MNRFISPKIGLDQLETAPRRPGGRLALERLPGTRQHHAPDQPLEDRQDDAPGRPPPQSGPSGRIPRSALPARALILSEEAPAHWAARQRLATFGPHVELLSRPFRNRPTADEWNELVDGAAELCRAGQLDLFVIDPLAPFLPGRCESDAGTLLEML